MSTTMSTSIIMSTSITMSTFRSVNTCHCLTYPSRGELQSSDGRGHITKMNIPKTPYLRRKVLRKILSVTVDSMPKEKPVKFNVCHEHLGGNQEEESEDSIPMTDEVTTLIFYTTEFKEGVYIIIHICLFHYDTLLKLAPNIKKKLPAFAELKVCKKHMGELGKSVEYWKEHKYSNKMLHMFVCSAHLAEKEEESSITVNKTLLEHFQTDANGIVGNMSEEQRKKFTEKFLKELATEDAQLNKKCEHDVETVVAHYLLVNIKLNIHTIEGADKKEFIDNYVKGELENIDKICPLLSSCCGIKFDKLLKDDRSSILNNIESIITNFLSEHYYNLSSNQLHYLSAMYDLRLNAEMLIKDYCFVSPFHRFLGCFILELKYVKEVGVVLINSTDKLKGRLLGISTKNKVFVIQFTPKSTIPELFLTLLQDNTVCKIIFNAWEVERQFDRILGITLNNVFDIRVADAIFKKRTRGDLLADLQRCLYEYIPHLELQVEITEIKDRSFYAAQMCGYLIILKQYLTEELVKNLPPWVGQTENRLPTLDDDDSAESTTNDDL